MYSKCWSFLSLAILLALAACSHLDSNFKSTLHLPDFVTSPFGYFRLKLRANCSIELQQFDVQSSQYHVSLILDLGKSGTTNCTFLNFSIETQSLLDSSGKVYISPSDHSQHYTRFKLKVNDAGTVYLVSYFEGPDNQLQYKVDNLSNGTEAKTNRFLYNLQREVKYTNKNNWEFSNSFGAISVRKNEANQNYMKLASLEGFRFEETGLVDPQGEVRYAYLPGMSMQSKAGGVGCTGSQGVFAEFDDYWPIVRIYDEDKYLIAQYGLDELSVSPCPEKTFRENGKCVTKCSSSLFQQVDGQGGQCVIKCRNNFKEDGKSQTCLPPGSNLSTKVNLNALLSRNCPAASTAYFYGCYCTNQKFYDFQNNLCVDNCPTGTYGSSGICMKCPFNCGNCQPNPNKKSFLACLTCSPGFSGVGCLVNSNQCEKVANCAKCSKDSIYGQEKCTKCSPFFALSADKKQCSQECPNDEVIAVGSGGEAYCLKPTVPSNADDYISSVFRGSPFLIRKSGTCLPRQKIFRDRCVASCPDGYDLNSDSRCLCKPGFGFIANETCYSIQEVSRNQLGMYYNSSLNSFLNCPIGCLRCDVSSCLECSPNHILVVSATSSVCRQDSIFFSCNSEYYTYDSANRICIASNLLLSFSNITNCKTEFKKKCIACQTGYYMMGQQCRKSCGEGYSPAGGRCIKSLPACYLPQLRSVPVQTKLDASVLRSPAYRAYSWNRMEISNDPFTQVLAVRDELGINSSFPVTATIFNPEIICRIAKAPPNATSAKCAGTLAPFLLVNGTCASKCPANTYPFSVQNNDSMCLANTTCSQRNNSTPFRLPDGTCASSCPPTTAPINFGNKAIQCIVLTQCQKQSMITPFELPNSKCSSSCPKGTVPQLQGSVNLKCIEANETQAGTKKVHIDSSVFEIGTLGQYKKRMFYFVVDRVLNLSDISVNFYDLSNQPMLSQSSSGTQSNNVELAQFQDKTYLAIESSADAVVLDLSKNIQQFSSSKGQRLASSIYGVSLESNRIQNTRSWLAIIAYVLSLMLIALHSIYIGNELIYKIDNFLIFAQTLYYFSFVHLLINASIGQFYYGFLWSQFGFFPNYFAGTIPQNYLEGNLRNQQASLNFLPNSYRLLTGDANFIRNAGFSFSLLATFLCAFFIIVVFIQILKLCGRYELWFIRIAKQSLIAGFQFVAMNIFYWAVAHLLCNRNTLFSGIQGEEQSHVAYRTSCSIASIAWICIYGVYMVGRFATDSIGGLYMFKRLAVATILAASASHNNGDDDRYKLFLIPLVAAEIIFATLRGILEKTLLKRQKVFIILETVLMLIAYLTIYLWNDTGFVAIYVSLVFFLFIFLFTADLMDVYLDNRDEYYHDNVRLIPGLRQKQILTPNDYEPIKNPPSQPDSDRRLRAQ